MLHPDNLHLFNDLLPEEVRERMQTRTRERRVWIIDWSQLRDTDRYIVFPVNKNSDGESYLGPAQGPLKGWQIKQLYGTSYAALPLPEFDFEAFWRDRK